MADCDVINGISDCTLSVTTPITVAPATLSGYTRITSFTFTPNLTGDFLESYHKEVSTIKTFWDFGDGYTLSAANTYTSSHIYQYPGQYTVTCYFYDNEGNALLNIASETITIKNFISTKIEVLNKNNISIRTGALEDLVRNSDSSKAFLNFKAQVTWQDYNPSGNTIYFAASGARSNIFDESNKYAHLVPYRGFYVKTNNGYNRVYNKHTIQLTPIYCKLDSNNNPYKVPAGTSGAVILGAETPADDKKTRIFYYDESDYEEDANPKIIFSIDNSKHTLKDLFVNSQTDVSINLSDMNYMESNIDLVTVNMIRSIPNRLVFTTTGMSDMKAPSTRRENSKFRVFIAAQNTSGIDGSRVISPTKYYNTFFYDPTGYDNNEVGKFKAEVRVGSITAEPDQTLTNLISCIKTDDLPYNTTLSSSELSSFLYINYTPTLSSNVEQTQVITISGQPASYMPVLTGEYTFTVIPSAENIFYKIKEYEFNYSETLKDYRFQEFLYEYENLFNDVLEPIVGTNLSEPGTLGKRFIEKIGNFVINNVDVDTCNIDVLKKLYTFLNEQSVFSSTIIPPDLKRMYDLFSIKSSLLFGQREKDNKNFNTFYNSGSAYGINIAYNTKIDTSTYMVSAGRKFVAVQKFNSEPIVITPMNVPTSTISTGSTSSYPLSDFNVYSNWGWPLDTSITGVDLELLYDFHYYRDTIYSNTIQNNIIDNRSVNNGTIRNNIDYQVRKGLDI